MPYLQCPRGQRLPRRAVWPHASWLALGCLLWLGTVSVPAQTAREANALWRKGQTAQREGRWDDAVADFGTLAALYPENPDAAVGLGFSYYKKGELAQAEKSYNAALTLNEHHPGALYGLGQIAIARQQWADAAERFQSVVRLAPDFEAVPTRLNLALALHAAGCDGDAAAVYQQLLDAPAVPHSADLYRSAIESAFAAKDFARSLKWSRDATERYPQNARLWDMLAWSCQMFNLPEESEQAFARSEKIAYPDIRPANQTVLSLPFRGSWRVSLGNGAGLTHRGLVGRFAWDFQAVNQFGRTRTGDQATRGTNEGFLSFGQDVLAPADGRVVAVKDGTSDNEPNHHSLSAFSGNYVLLEHAPGELSLLEHLQNGSIEVNLGDTVKRGQKLARCGNSGNTTFPHLHFSFIGLYQGIRVSMPAAFSNYFVQGDDKMVPVKSGVPAFGDIVQSEAGDRLESVSGN